MKTSVQAALAAVLCSLSLVPSTHASGRVGNGGFAYVCRDTSGAITEARLLDLWEAEGVSTWRKDDSIDSQLKAALDKLAAISPNAYTNVTENLESFRASAVFSGRSLNTTDDAFPPYKPGPGCSYEQVARYEPLITETGKSGLRIAAEIFNSPYFSNSDRAALFFHESAYFVDRRTNKAENSQLTRLVTAHLFSDSKIPNTVRLATAALLVGKKRWEDFSTQKVKIPATVVAVPDPARIKFEIQFSTVDGINSDNLHTMTTSQRSALYRCVSTAIEAPGKPVKTDTGWVKLSELVMADVYDTSPDLIRIHGQFPALEFTEGFVPMRNAVFLVCESRSGSGKSKSVSFKDAVFKLPEGQSLYVSADDSLVISDGETPLSPTISSNYDSARSQGLSRPHMGIFYPEIVQGLF